MFREVCWMAARSAVVLLMIAGAAHATGTGGIWVEQQPTATGTNYTDADTDGHWRWDVRTSPNGTSATATSGVTDHYSQTVVGDTKAKTCTRQLKWIWQPCNGTDKPGDRYFELVCVGSCNSNAYAMTDNIEDYAYSWGLSKISLSATETVFADTEKKFQCQSERMAELKSTSSNGLGESVQGSIALQPGLQLSVTGTVTFSWSSKSESQVANGKEASDTTSINLTKGRRLAEIPEISRPSIISATAQLMVKSGVKGRSDSGQHLLETDEDYDAKSTLVNAEMQEFTLSSAP